MEEKGICSICKAEFDYGDMYEYRGAISCENCFEKLQEIRNAEREQIIEEEKHKTDRFKGIDLSDSVIGKANRKILKRDIEIAKKESSRLKYYNQSGKPNN